jgi:hypothetical protein
MTALVTLEEIKDRLRIDTDASDTDLLRMADEATEIVLNYLKRPQELPSDDDAYDEPWTPDTVPGSVRSAILLVVRSLHDEVDEPLSDTVRALVHRYRDPAMA